MDAGGCCGMQIQSRAQLLGAAEDHARCPSSPAWLGGAWDVLTLMHSLFPPSLVFPRENSPLVTLLVWFVGVQVELADCPLPPHHINPNLASKSSKRYKELKS